MKIFIRCDGGARLGAWNNICAGGKL